MVQQCVCVSLNVTPHLTIVPTHLLYFTMSGPMMNRPRAIIYRFINVLSTAGRLKFDYVNIASRHLPDFIDTFYSEPDLQILLEELQAISFESDLPIQLYPAHPQMVRDSVCLYMNWFMKLDNKAKIGKARDGPINKLVRWVLAYGLAKDDPGITVHERFAQALKQRSEEGIKQYVFSKMTLSLVDTESKLLAFTTQGDLTRYVDGYFNTSLYSPTQMCSYQIISHELNVPLNQMLVVSASLEECAAACEAGCIVVKGKRPGETKDCAYPRVQDMSKLMFQPKDKLVAKWVLPPSVNEKVSTRKNASNSKMSGNKKSSLVKGKKNK